ncbi:efflux RND transporter periplasmic adaptor subunit [Sinomicrobium soli]|uniref:efflux RND transporter periplasmic adaptor subunit n=1 Tax=Sinomicrobium sp. N-1-3-6 TaxID=2219864 RepID=UPI000DCC05D0|nr:efflux RND transporter periplasmic adaptor subunit [Sinomicrobium sp. N-1-3-6]RAV29964.1 efflux RND transporter periplasmic adaptor subunit [Sinomicrobium sp. N-1-3-6]
MNHRISKNITSVIASVLVLTFASCSQQEKKKEQQPDQITGPVTYPTTAVRSGNPEYEISVPAELKPYEQVSVYARVSGFVKRLEADRGDYVRKGQLLAVLEAPEMEQQYLSDKSTEQKVHSDYRYARQAYERLAEASKTTGAVAELELDRARSALESARSAYEASQAGTARTLQLQRYLRITAPFDGVITRRNVSVGALTGTGDKLPLFEMAQENRLRLTLSLPEKHAASVKQEMQAEFTVSSQPGKIFNARLSRSSGLLDQRDRALKLEFDIDNSSGVLQGGDYAQVSLKLQRKDPSYWVPLQSVLNTQSGVFVMVLNGNGIKRIPVKEGIRLDSIVEVFGDISPGEQVLSNPSEEIR